MDLTETRKRVVEVTANQLIWRFADNAADAYPLVNTGSSYSTTRVDPFPAYAHNLDTVVDALSWVESAIAGRACGPIAHQPTVYVLDREPLSRTNGWASVDHRYYRDERPEGAPKWEGVIVLGGKRIPLHPAMTRYLVAHEYGHHVEYEMLHRRGLDPGDNAIRDEYAELRGCDRATPYGGGTWHKSPGELLANDFRIAVAGVEPEFWPHPGFEHPLERDDVKAWWAENF